MILDLFSLHIYEDNIILGFYREYVVLYKHMRDFLSKTGLCHFQKVKNIVVFLIVSISDDQFFHDPTQVLITRTRLS